VARTGRGQFDRSTQRVVGARRQTHIKHYAPSAVLPPDAAPALR
jgi:hypothetical protein